MAKNKSNKPNQQLELPGVPEAPEVEAVKESSTYTMAKYLEDSKRTTGPAKDVTKALNLVHNLQDQTIFNKSQIAANLFRIINTGNISDAYKRATFYGDNNVQHRLTVAKAKSAELADITLAKDPDMTDEKSLNVLHAIWGISSELGEVCESVVKSKIRGEELDTKNIREELGDILWYMAILVREIGSSFEETAEINIKKLEVRFPEKFTNSDALNRDLDAEKEVLDN